MDLKLMDLEIRNFKGCGSLSLPLDGRSASIYGDNAAGKTTVYDALTWLLFGKDSRGNGSFEIKPLDAAGEVADHGAVTEVSATLWADGEPVTLRKTYYEKWSVKRGNADATYDGNTSEYYVDDVPVKKYAFEAKVDELASEDRWRMLTSVGWFCEGLDWRKRREALFEVCGVASDREIMEQEPRFAALMESMGRLSLEDYKKKLQAKRRGLNGARDTVPARLDECKKTVSELEGIDFTALEEERGQVAARRDSLRGELIQLENNTLLASKRNDVARLENELAALRNENRLHRQSQIVPVEDRRPALEAEIRAAEQDLLRCTQLAQNEKDLMEHLEERIGWCRARWSEAAEQTFDETVCPTCGQRMPEEAQKAARAAFEADRKRVQTEAVEEADRAKADRSMAQARREDAIEAGVRAENEIARLRAELEAYRAPAPAEVEDLPGFARQEAELTATLEEARRQSDSLSRENGAIRTEIEGRISELQQQMDRLDRDLGRRAMLDYAKERMEALRQEARESGQQLEELDKLLFLCDEFSRCKVRYIEDQINGRFRLVRWKLFQEQVNGGLADCCEATVDGVPYRSMNNGSRVNAGLDVIRTLSEHYGMRVPLFIDNAESVTGLLPVGSQTVRLVVSAGDKELRCEYEN